MGRRQHLRERPPDQLSKRNAARFGFSLSERVFTFIETNLSTDHVITADLNDNMLPLTARRGAEHCLDHQHVLERVFERHRHWTVLKDRSGKQVALNRVLVADGELLDAVVD